MKSPRFESNGRLAGMTLGLLATVAGCTAACAQNTTMRDAATHEQLSLQLRKAEQNDPMKKLPVSKGEDVAKNLPTSLLDNSDFISFSGVATLVPKRAIIQLPKNYADRIKIVQGCRILNWQDFFAINRGWITTVEVTRKQAEGNDVLPEETTKTLSKSGNLIVAVYKGGPISMLPTKEKDPEAKPQTVSTKP